MLGEEIALIALAFHSKFGEERHTHMLYIRCCGPQWEGNLIGGKPYGRDEGVNRFKLHFWEGPYFFIGVTHYSDGEGALVHSTVKAAIALYYLGVTHYSDGEDRQGA